MINHTIMTMITIIIISTIGSIILFHTTKDAALKKTEKLKINTPKSQIKQDDKNLRTYTMITHV